MDIFAVGYLAFVLAVIVGIIYVIATKENDRILLGLVMGLLSTILAGIIMFSACE